MDSTQQAEGQRRVRSVLIEPLKKRGLAKPTSLTRAQFEEMQEDMSARLAYMSVSSLAALEEQVANNPGGKERDRFPIANKILEWAGQIQPPGDDASPLIRAVFAHALGRDAVANGWAPELLAEVRRTRRWPGTFAATQVRERADADVRRLAMLDARAARGDLLTPSDSGWRDRRHAALDKCRRLVEMGDAHG